MSAPTNDLDAVQLSALMSSRLCHDLVNPVGALASGLEVLGDPSMDEGMQEAALDLIKSSAEKSVALLKYARLAYGASGGLGAELPLDEAHNVLKAYFAWTKATLDWTVPGAHAPKDEVKALLVLAAAAADCVPRGGAVSVSGANGDYEIRVTGQRVILQEDLKKALAGDADELKPKFAPHFISALAARQTGGGVDVSESEGGVSFRIAFSVAAAALTGS